MKDAARLGAPMKAIVYSDYGLPDVIRCEETERPTPGDNEALIRVRAAAVNPLDWHSLRGKPYFLRMMTGLRKPKDTRLGVDVAGVVEAVGRNVTALKPGEVLDRDTGEIRDVIGGGEIRVRRNTK